jgi:hypothetical protein
MTGGAFAKNFKNPTRDDGVWGTRRGVNRNAR